MTYKYLTVTMIRNVRENGIIDQTVFKMYGFDSLIFSRQVIDIINGYISCIRPRLNPNCDYLLITRNGTQLTRISDVFGRLVFQAIGKYINPTRYRQIIETESAENLTIDDQQALSEDHKHTSLVAKVHYQKLQSREVAEQGKIAMDKLRNESQSVHTIQRINDSLTSVRNRDVTDFDIETNVLSSIDVKQSNSKNVKRQKKVPFSEIEDKFLRAGIKKYGCKWTAILSDPELKFHSSRQSATLITRAKNQKFIF